VDPVFLCVKAYVMNFLFSWFIYTDGHISRGSANKAIQMVNFEPDTACPAYKEEKR
jgi:hypothetical protein